MITHKEAIKEAMRDPQFEIIYKSNHFWVELSKFFYNERKERALSAKKFSKICGIPKRRLKKIESGSCNLSLAELSIILERIGYYLNLNFKEYKEDVEVEEE